MPRSTNFVSKIARQLAAGLCACATAIASFALAPATAQADQLPDLMLASFWNSETDLSDTLYMSTDGLNFQRLSTPYQTIGHGSLRVKNTPYTVNSLHDPDLFYTRGNYWMISGYVADHDHTRFRPMMGSSRDLVHWSYPNNHDTMLTPIPAPLRGTRNIDNAGPDAMGDTDGSVWIVTTLGYFGFYHGRPEHDTMYPYIVHINSLTPGTDQQKDPGRQPNVRGVGKLTRINLPEKSSNWLDPSLYKENGTYYLSIKKLGFINQIYSIKDLNQAGNPRAWHTVCRNVVSGYERPSLTKFRGLYRMYTDKLADFPDPKHADGKTGVFVTVSDHLSGGWHGTRRIRTTDEHGRPIPNRHGSVLTITDPRMKQMIWNLRVKKGYSYFVDVPQNAWFRAATDFVNARHIMTGYGNASFGPNNALSREEAATLLWKRAGSPSVSDALNYKDANLISSFARPAVAWVQQTGAMSGYGDTGYFGPRDTLTREQTAKIIQIASSHEGETASDATFLSLRNHDQTHDGLHDYMV